MINITLRFRGRLQLGHSQHVTQYVRVRAFSIKTEHVNIPIGGRGSITLDISHAIRTDVKNPKILISLPPGPIYSSQDASSDSWRSLVRAKQPSTTLINLNYRLSAPTDRSTSNEIFRYPQPIHDCSVAFSQILTKVIPRLFPTHQLREPWGTTSRPSVGLIGTHIGAALATMLALTNPNDVGAVAIADPLVDWVIVNEIMLSPLRQVPPSSSRSRRSSSPAMPSEAHEDVVLAAKHLINMRTKLFPTPSMYFDPFASPTLFLRAPGRDTPRTHAEALGMLNDESDDMEHQVQGSDEWKPIATHDYLGTMPNPDTDVEDTVSASAPADLDTLTEAMGTDSFGPYDDDIPKSSSPSLSTTSTPSRSTATHTTALSSQSSVSPPSSPTQASGLSPESPAEDTPSQKQKQPKRRKVLRRWPPNNQTDVLLPYFQVCVSPPPTPPPSSLSTADTHLQKGLYAITTMQASELIDLLRRACFSGREKGFAEDRVNLIRFSDVLRDQGQGQSQKMAGDEGKGVSAGNNMGEEARMVMMLDWLVAKMDEGNANDSP